MTTRRLVPPAALAALLLALGCTAPDDSKREGTSTTREEKKENTPKAKKTTAEAIVGTWKLVKTNGKEIPEDWSITQEFTADGKHIAHSRIPKRKDEQATGVYTVTGDNVKITRVSNADTPVESWDIKVRFVSDEEIEVSTNRFGSEENNVCKKVSK